MSAVRPLCSLGWVSSDHIVGSYGRQLVEGDFNTSSSGIVASALSASMEVTSTFG